MRSYRLRASIADLTESWIVSNAPTEQIEKALQVATAVFEDAQFAKDWLNQPNLATDGKPPIALLGTEEGFGRLELLLRRIEYGVLA